VGSERSQSGSGQRAEIEAAIPHRAPFLFVDRILAREAQRIVTEWDVRADLPAFAGHYPGFPVLPGVLISEFVFQSAAILLSGESPGTVDGSSSGAGVPVLTRIEDARFRRMVRPGETLRAEVAITDSVANARFARASVTSGGKKVLQARFAVALAPLAPLADEVA
jgi:3-hydroxyacyl-[acyl-carrier-protein] dehydratase